MTNIWMAAAITATATLAACESTPTTPPPAATTAAAAPSVEPAATAVAMAATTGGAAATTDGEATPAPAAGGMKNVLGLKLPTINKSVPNWQHGLKPPDPWPAKFDAKKDYFATIHTTKGDITVKFFPEVALHPADAGLLPKGVAIQRRDVGEGTLFDLGGRKIEVIGIPGHTPGSVAFLDRAGRYIMTGDGIGSTMVWMQISNLPLTTYLASVKRLEAMKDGIDELYVGHHEQEKVTLTRQYITDMRIVTEKVLNGTIDTSPYAMGGGRGGQQASFGMATLVFSPERAR